MLKEKQFVVVKWNPFTQKYYQSKGYFYTKRGEAFLVKIEDLLEGSHAKVSVVCDFCGEEYKKVYKDYFAQHENGDCCQNCQGQKSLKTGRQRYGEQYRGETLKEIAQKRYGVNNVAKSPEIQQRIRETNVERYGVENCLLLKESQNKGKQRAKTKEVKEKRKNTNLEKYGYEYGLSSPVVRNKIIQSYYKNGSQKTSQQQKQLQNVLNEIYGNCELNYPCGQCSLDCMVEINGIKIDVEYDGEYWHQDIQRDRKRDEFVKSQGYKIFRIRGSHTVPTFEEIKNKINILLTTNKHFIQLKVK